MTNKEYGVFGEREGATKNGGKITHYQSSAGYEEWRECNAQGKEIHHKDSNGFEWWSEFDAQGNRVHHKTSKGYEWWREFDAQGNQVYYTDGVELWSNPEYWRERALKAEAELKKLKEARE